MKVKKKQEDELELYDGQRASLHDKKVTSDYIPALYVSAIGKETFALSESLYCKWLEDRTDTSLIDRAVALCREAVALGYPQAVVKMGFYYDKDYIDSERTEEYRCRVATDYYGKVVYSNDNIGVEKFVNPETGATEYVKPDVSWEELKKIAARMLLEMLASSEAAQSRDALDKYGYAYNRAAIPDSIKVEKNYVMRSKDMVEMLEDVLDSCRENTYRAPLFGVVKLTLDEAQRVFTREGFGIKQSKKINIWLICGSQVLKVSATNDFSKKFKNFADETVWVCYFNCNLGGHRFINQQNRVKICNAFSKDNCHAFKKLIESDVLQKKKSLLFSDDDVYFHMTSRLSSPLKAAEKLIDTVIN